jgi:hypothetical protein
LVIHLLAIFRVWWIWFIKAIVWCTRWIFNFLVIFAKFWSITSETFFASIQEMPTWNVLVSNRSTINANAFLLFIFMGNWFILEGPFELLDWLLLSLRVGLLHDVLLMLAALKFLVLTCFQCALLIFFIFILL